MRIFFFCILQCLVSGSVWAWSGTGHMITAAVAYEHLSDAARREVDALTHVFQAREPRVQHFVELSVWPDDLKRQGIMAYNHWHYIDRYYFDQIDANLPPVREDNIVTRLHFFDVVYRTSHDPRQRAWALSFLSHLFADIHQPLHNITRVSADFPRGDRGGTKVLVDKKKNKTLHQLWDRGLDQGAYFKWPLPESHLGRLLATAREMEQGQSLSYGATGPVFDPETWSDDGYRLAIATVYPGIVHGVWPEPAYFRRNIDVVKQQLVLGGLRLACYLNEIQTLGLAKEE